MIKSIILFTIVFFNIIHTSAQEYIYIKISEGKTTHLIFPSDVKYYDYGSEDVAVQETSEGHIIKVKAVYENFKSTNLTVMTNNNVFYSFILTYESSPGKLNYFIEEKQGVKYNKEEDNRIERERKKDTISSELEADLNQFELLKKINNNNFISGTRDNRVTLVLKDIIVDKDNLYFILDAKNESAISYDVEFIKFFIKPKKKNKKSSIQDIEITPISSVNVPKELIKDSSGLSYFSFALKKMTIAPNKKFVVEMWEKNGERSIELEINDKMILNAKNISAL